ncbi:MAG: TIR domain-containing protein [Desulfuromonadales bacterium]|nr:MAG: TIR domain-containing protein [Desulfuromonadales bacterium]
MKARTYDIFISHASEDVAEARWLRQTLGQAGWKSFVASDDLNLKVGSAEWSSKVDEAIDQSGLVVVIVTPDSLGSRWVEYEWRSVHTDILGQRPDKPGMIIPCCFREKSPDDLERGLRRYQSVDFRDPGRRTGALNQLLALIENFLKKPVETQAKRAMVRALAIEGGGVRALIPGRLLMALERKLQAIAGPQSRLVDHLDLVAGTSTGGILACLLTTPEMDLTRAVERFRSHLAVAFKSSGLLDKLRHFYDADALRQVMAQGFGDLKLSQLSTACLLPTYDLTRRGPLLMGQHRATADPAVDLLVADAALAAISVPIYFEPCELAFPDGTSRLLIDGCLFAKNPAGIALDEARNHFVPRPLASDICLLSLGSGRLTDEKRDMKGWHFWDWMPELLQIAMDSTADLVHAELAQLYHGMGRPQQYLRIDAALPSDAPSAFRMDNTTPETLDALERLGDELARHYDVELDQFARLLAAEGGGEQEAN